MQEQFFVYILTNQTGTVLYVGITNDICRRVDEHAAGVGSKFTTRYRLNRLLYYETFDDPRQAIAREKQIKGWRRSKKEALIQTLNPRLENLRAKLAHPSFLS